MLRKPGDRDWAILYCKPVPGQDIGFVLEEAERVCGSVYRGDRDLLGRRRTPERGE